MTASRIVITVIVGLWSVSAPAQIPPAPATPPNGPDQQDQTAGGAARGARDTRQNNARGSGDASDPNAQKNPNAPTDPNAVKDPNAPQKSDETTEQPAEASSGPELIDDPNATPEQKASAEYSGPAVLSRGISASEPMNPKNVKFTPSLGIEFLENSGLTGVSTQPNGQLSNAASAGLQLTYGLIGEKVYKRDIFSLTFSGDLYHYAQQSYYDGSDDSLSLTWRHKLSRHLSFGTRLSAQQYNRNNLLLSGSGYIDSSVGTTLVTATPATEVFDGRVISLFAEGDVTYQMTSRLSMNLSGGGFTTRRRSTALYGDTGSQAGADLAYRLTRHVTAGTYYSYTHFDFIGIYGATDVNTVGLTYSIAFNPRTELITRVGGSRLESTGITSIQVDPIIAALFGSSSALEATYKVNYAPDVNVQLRRKVSNLTLSLAYERGVTPGNGVILTSVRQSADFGANYKYGRYWFFDSTGGYDALSGFGITTEKYASVFVGAGVYRAIRRNLDWHTRFDFHHYTFDNTGFLRNTFVFSTGIVWNPGNVLERVW